MRQGHYIEPRLRFCAKLCRINKASSNRKDKRFFIRENYQLQYLRSKQKIRQRSELKKGGIVNDETLN